MSYKIMMDSGDGNFINILSYNNKNKCILEPKLTDEVNTIGDLEFKMPPTHKYYDLPHILKSTVEVYEDNDCIWFGRVLSIETNYYREKIVHCEGAMGWFNDVPTTFKEYEKTSTRQLFRKLLNDYYVGAEENRRIRVGNVTVEDIEMSERVGYDTILNVIESKCLDQVEGYIFFRKDEHGYWADWLKEMPYTCNQPIDFGLNLIDIKSTFDGSEIITAILPYGDTVRQNDDPGYGDPIPEGDSRIGKPLVLYPGYESNVIKSSWVDQYGLIIKPVQFSGSKKVQDLYVKANKYLMEELYNRLTFEISAIDLKHSPKDGNSNYQAFKLGQKVKCKSLPHGLYDINEAGEKVSREFPLLKIEIELDTATKTVSLGTAPRKKMTDLMLNNADVVTPGNGMVFEIQEMVEDPVTHVMTPVFKRIKDTVISFFYTNDYTNEEPGE